MQNIWIDLTDLFYWRGHFTGIQRVAYNYASRFSGEGVRFFIYSTHYQRFVEIRFDLFKEWAKETSDSSLDTQKQKIKKALKTKLQSLPKIVKFMLERPLRKLLHWYRFILSRTIYRAGDQKVLRKLPRASFQKTDTVLVLGAAWNEEKFVDEIINKKDEVHFKLAVHLNDILPVYQPHLFAKDLPLKFSAYAHKMLKASDVALTISQASRDDIIKYCKQNDFPNPEVKVIRLGEDISTAKPQKPNINTLRDKYILSVGTFEIRKNHILLYQALKIAQAEHKQLPQIIIAGRKGWLTEDLQYLVDRDPSTQSALLHMDQMSDENLSWLYENCMFTVFPSLSEGWGLPIAESLHHGKFCLSSNTSSMPEIAGSMIDYFSPLDPKHCLDKIIEYSSDKEKLKQKTKTIKNDYKTFTWDDSFEQFKQALG